MMMTWADFWGLTGTLDGKADEAGCRRLAAALSKRPVSDIQGLAECLAEALYRLDQEKFGTLPVADLTLRDGEPFPRSAGPEGESQWLRQADREALMSALILIRSITEDPRAVGVPALRRSTDR